MMFRRLIWIHLFITLGLFVCITSFYLSLTVILTSHFSNITYFRQQQQQNKPMKYYEISPTHTETPCNTTRKIANLCIEFNYHFLTLPKKIPLLLNRSVHCPPNIFLCPFLDFYRTSWTQYAGTMKVNYSPSSMHWLLTISVFW